MVWTWQTAVCSIVGPRDNRSNPHDQQQPDDRHATKTPSAAARVCFGQSHLIRSPRDEHLSDTGHLAEFSERVDAWYPLEHRHQERYRADGDTCCYRHCDNDA